MNTTLSSTTLWILLLAGIGLLAPKVEGQARPYHILLTNDDGIESPGIQALARALESVGEVHLVASCGERSGSSMSVALRDQLTLRPVQRDGRTLGHCVDTTPAGTVLLAITSLAPEGGYDLVISGINRGANVGTSSHMSGTVGAAMMGAFYGIPAIAASLGGRAVDFEYPAGWIGAFVEEMKSRAATPGMVLSINIPASSEADITGVTVAGMGGAHLWFAYEEVADRGVSGEARRFRPRIGLATEAPENTDTEAFLRNRITIAPLLFDWTAYSALDELRAWAPGPEIAP